MGCAFVLFGARAGWTPRNSVIHRPVDPAVIAALRANHEAIRKLLEAD